MSGSESVIDSNEKSLDLIKESEEVTSEREEVKNQLPKEVIIPIESPLVNTTLQEVVEQPIPVENQNNPSVMVAELVEQGNNYIQEKKTTTFDSIKEKTFEIKEKIFSKIKEIAEDSLTEIRMANPRISNRIYKYGVDGIFLFPDCYGLNKLGNGEARYFIRKGFSQEVSNRLDNFETLDKSLAFTLMKNSDRCSGILYNKNKFEGLTDDEIISCLKENDKVYEIASNLKCFSNLGSEMADLLLEHGYGFWLKSYVQFFKGLKKEHADYLSHEFELEDVWKNSESFEDISDSKLTDQLLENGKLEKISQIMSFSYEEKEHNVISYIQLDILLDHIMGGAFKDLNNNMAKYLSENGYGNVVLRYIGSFQNIDKELIKAIVLNKFAYSKGMEPVKGLLNLSTYGLTDDEERELYKLYVEANDHKLLNEDSKYMENLLSFILFMKEKNQPVEIKLCKEIFGASLSVSRFSLVKNLLLEKPVSDDLRALGVTLTGVEGITQLKTITKELLNSINLANFGEKELNLLQNSRIVRDMLCEMSGFRESNWGEVNDDSLLKKIESVRMSHTDGTFTELPKGYDISKVYEISKLNSKDRLIEFSEDVTSRYSILRDDILDALAAVRTKGGMGVFVEEIREGIGKIYSKIEGQISSIDTSNPKADIIRKSLENKKKEISEYIQTIDMSSRRNPDIPAETQAHYVAQSPVAIQRGLSALGNYEELYSPIRKLVFSGAFRKHRGQIDKMNKLTQFPTIESLSSVTEFVNHIVSKGTYGEYFSGDKRLSETFQRISTTKALSDGLKSLTNRATREGKSRIQFIPTRGLMLEMSGQIADACWADNYYSIGEEMPNMSVIIMRARPDEKTERIIGAALAIESFNPVTGEEVLILRGINPRENYINTVDTGEFYNAITDYVKDTARKRGMIPAIVIDDQSGGSATNRERLFNFLSAKTHLLKKIEVDYKSTYFNYYDVTDCTYRLDQ